MLSSCSKQSEPQSFDNCPNLDLTQVKAAENSPEYFDEVAQLVNSINQELVGKSEQNVEYCANYEGLVYRVAAKDGEFFALTMDYSPTRINVEIEKNIVVKINVG